MTTKSTRDTCISLHRRFIVEASTTPLLTAAQEQRLARRIDTARRRLLGALALWPPCIATLLDDFALARDSVRQRERLIVGLQDAHPDTAGGLIATMVRITAQLAQLETAHRHYLDSATAHGWAHVLTRRPRKAVAMQLCALRLHDSCLRRLLSLPDQDPPPALDLPWTAMRARIAAARRAFEMEKQRLVSANLRLVTSVARRYRFCEVAQADLIQEGNIGLMRAVEKFDHRRGCKFSTYAIWWIQRAMVLAITLQRSTLSVPAYALQAAHRAQRRAAQQRLQGAPAPSLDQLAAFEVMTATDLRAAYAACLPTVPLCGEGDDDLAPINTLHDSRQPDPADILMQSELRQHLHGVLARLPERQAQVLRLRYGIGVDEPHTLDAIGRQLGLSRERIRQIEQQALGRLRTDAYRSQLAPLLDDPCHWRPTRPASGAPLQDSAS